MISGKGSPNIKGLGKLRYVVEQTFALQPHLLEAPAEGPLVILLRARTARLTARAPAASTPESTAITSPNTERKTILTVGHERGQPAGCGT